MVVDTGVEVVVVMDMMEAMDTAMKAVVVSNQITFETIMIVRWFGLSQ